MLIVQGAQPELRYVNETKEIFLCAFLDIISVFETHHMQKYSCQ